MPANDPRFLGATDEEIALDLEADLFLREEALRTCKKCGSQTYREHCPVCPESPYLPISEMEELFERERQGGTVDFDDYLKIALGDRVGDLEALRSKPDDGHGDKVER